MTKSEALQIAQEVQQHTQLNNKTTNKHMGKIFLRLYHYGGLYKYFSDHDLTKSTWYKYKSAYQYGASQVIRNLLQQAESLEKSDLELSKAAQQEALRLATELQDLHPDYTKQHRLLASQHTEKSQPYSRSKTQGKRRALRGLPDNWQKLMIEHLPPRHKLPALVMTLTGCRPAELFRGVLIQASEARLKFTVQGAKFIEGYQGQKERFITIHPDKAPALYEHALTGQFTVSIDNVETFRKAFTRTAQKLGFKSLSPYCLRHQFTSNLKEELGIKWTREDLAKALGHITDRCQQCYGHPQQSRGGSGLLTIQATSEIKANRGTIPDIDDSPGLKST